MNKTVFSALAVLAASTLGHASETEDWLGLDKELESLRSTIATTQNASGVGFSGFFRTSYQWVDESDVSGISVDNIRLNWMGRVEDFDIFVQYDASNFSGSGINVGGFEGVLDAYGTWNFQDEFRLTFGQFRPAVLHSSWLDENELFFYNRTFNGGSFAFRDQGLMLSGNFEQIGWWAGVQNGADGGSDKYAYFGRVEFDAMGDGAGDVEGAMGSTDELALTVGGAIYVDDFFDDGTVWALDANATMAGFSAAAEVVGFDKDLTGTGDSETSWNAQATYMIVPDEWEVGVRFEDLDKVLGDDTTAFTVAGAHYMAGHNAKLQAAFTTVNSDINNLDTESISLGLTLAW